MKGQFSADRIIGARLLGAFVGTCADQFSGLDQCIDLRDGTVILLNKESLRCTRRGIGQQHAASQSHRQAGRHTDVSRLGSVRDGCCAAQTRARLERRYPFLACGLGSLQLHLLTLRDCVTSEDDMAAPRSGGDDLTENWESGTDEAQSSKKRKLDEQPTPKPAAASTPRPKKPKQIAAAITKAHTKASPAVAAVTSADAASARPLCFQSAEEQAGGFWQLYLQSKCGKMLTSIEQSAARATQTDMRSATPNAASVLTYPPAASPRVCAGTRVCPPLQWQCCRLRRKKQLTPAIHSPPCPPTCAPPLAQPPHGGSANRPPARPLPTLRSY